MSKARAGARADVRRRQRGDRIPCAKCGADMFVYATCRLVNRRRIRYYRCAACGETTRRVVPIVV